MTNHTNVSRRRFLAGAAAAGVAASLAAIGSSLATATRYLLRSPAPRGHGRQVRYDFLPLSLE